LLTPLVLITAVYQARHMGIRWAGSRVAEVAAWLVALRLIAFGIVEDMLHLSLTPAVYGNTVRLAGLLVTEPRSGQVAAALWPATDPAGKAAA
jgi:hypothetical protein